VFVAFFVLNYKTLFLLEIDNEQ